MLKVGYFFHAAPKFLLILNYILFRNFETKFAEIFIYNDISLK